MALIHYENLFLFKCSVETIKQMREIFFLFFEIYHLETLITFGDEKKLNHK